MGWNTTASGHSSTSMGVNTTASGHYSTAMGLNTTASGNFSTTMGSSIETAGERSFGIGLDITARTITMDNVMAIMGGNVGIGTTDPSNKLTVHNGRITVQGTYPKPQVELHDLSSNRMFTMITDGDDFKINNDGIMETVTVPLMINGSTDYIGIGTTSPDYKLDVNGAIRATEIIVEETDGADFVFEKGYKLADLNEIESFIKDNNHLPGIPTSAIMKSQGINMGKFQVKLLQKIEELTLYLIDMQKENENLKNRISSLETTK